MSATRIVLVRHGETEWNRRRRVQGHTDVPLNDEGRRQAHALAAELDGEEVDAVYSSDLSRARETAEILSTARAVPVVSLPELREKHFGTWEGLTDREVLERFPDAHATGWGDGESSDEMAERIVRVVERIVEAHEGELVLVVTHGGPMRAILGHYDGETAPIANCGVVRLEARDGVVRRVR
jgi:alpha-ribazole phosphatase/probable phosphoglycerate mutase